MCKKCAAEKREILAMCHDLEGHGHHVDEIKDMVSQRHPALAKLRGGKKKDVNTAATAQEA